ncbi:MAG: DUF2520 domain-containing protein [Candidatus Magnetomorum sp.]|nr:DUF2520 domain-containing protein [Candidatus Magnetomorum sp.]
MSSTINFAIIGCGRLGTNLSIRLKEAGHTPVGLSSRHLESIQNANEFINAQIIDTIPWNVTSSANVVFITTPDDSIETVCQQLIENNGFNSNAIVYHCSGSLSSSVLAAASAAGLNVGSFHPVQSFPVIYIEPNPFERIYVSVEGDPIAIELGKKIAIDLKASVVEVSTDGKKLYHAAAVVASNYLITLLEMAKQFNIHAGLSENEALAILKPLIQGTLNNIDKQGIPGALTGPISRGDIKTIRDHIQKIQQIIPDFLDLYQTLGRYTVPIAQAQKTISTDSASLLNKQLAKK